MDTGLILKLRQLFDLRTDTDYEKTDESIRQNVDFKSANAWTLVFAIFVASVGLNVNSTAVIIGAMLISPLMGPIVGAGYSLGVNDFSLLKRAGRNLFIAVVISIITSTIFFLISPFDEAQSELLARTSPNFYDVLIAAFGGAAGIVAASRKEKSNAVPGVAIATALMPPLCTAGFGIANLEWKYFLGAMYLFVINSVFICLSTYIFIRYLKFRKTSYSEPKEQKRIDRWIMIIATVVIVPSLVTAWLLMKESSFKFKANSFIAQEVRYPSTFIMERRIQYAWEGGEIVLTMVGEKLNASELKKLKEKKKFYGLEKAELKIQEVSIEDTIDKKIARSARAQNDRGLFYQQKIGELEQAIQLEKDQHALEDQSLKELKIFHNTLVGAFIKDESVNFIWKRAPAKSARLSVESFMRLKLGREKLVTTHSVQI